MIYILVLVVLGLLILTYYGANRNLMYLSVLVVLATLLYIVSAMYSIELWNIN